MVAAYRFLFSNGATVEEKQEILDIARILLNFLDVFAFFVDA